MLELDLDQDLYQDFYEFSLDQAQIAYEDQNEDMDYPCEIDEDMPF